MKNKTKKILLLFLLLVFFSSCVKRRFDYLYEKKIEKEVAINKKDDGEKTIFPDEIIKLSFDDYKKWYKNLKASPILNLPSSEDPKELTKDQMVEDFEYYFKQIKENYPFFGVLKREYGIDFIKKHDQYLKKVKKSKNDEDFILTMKEITRELKNHHANIADKTYVEKTQEYFSNYWQNPSMYLEFLSLNTQKVRNRYGLDGYQSQNYSKQKAGRKKSMEVDQKTIDAIENSEKAENNMTINYLADDIAIIKIKEMVSGDSLENDRKVLKSFLEQKDKYNKLIIDIRDNAGGSMDYWREFLLPEILREDKTITNYMFFKAGKKTKQILELEKENVEPLKNINLDQLELSNKEDLKDFYYYKEDPIEIKAKGEGFLGQIFLLTNERVYSSAEGLASFIKNTKVATIVGTNTGGDGITLGLVNEVMPNSGLVFTYTNTLGYAPDGTINEEEKTKPDINASSYKESIEIIKNYQ